MPKLAANLSMMFEETPFLDRFAVAADCGFAGVEFLFPYDFPADEIAARLERHHLTQALFNLPPGDWAKGERGMAALPGREDEFMKSLERALPYARATKCRRLHAMAGNWPEGQDRREGRAVYVANLRHAADRLAEEGVTLVIEPINTRDMPGYFLNTTGDAMSVIEEAGRENLKLQLDLYHCQIMEGDLAMHVRRLAGRYAHVQIAGVPERHEPDQGEVNYDYLLPLLDEVGYDGWVGCEYRPAGDTRAGLGWAKRWARHRAS
ncbi:MAG TPA: 2-oxo-tetronate isomerase [Roseiarcus sp.]|nr:2-oxo-tetronate isomerase [Roseiarcus sp.]